MDTVKRGYTGRRGIRTDGGPHSAGKVEYVLLLHCQNSRWVCAVRPKGKSQQKEEVSPAACSQPDWLFKKTHKNKV